MVDDKHSDEPLEEDEAELNPAPLPYRVSFRTKVGFLLLLVLGAGTYLYMIVERRVSQSKFLIHNQMAAVKLVQAAVPKMLVYDLKTDRDVELGSELNTWVLLNIWATWCPPCKEEMPSLELLQQKLKGRLKIVALSVDDNVDAVKDFVNVNKPSFLVLWDKHRSSPIKFGVDKYPETFLISPDGLLTTQFSGPRDWGSASAFDYFLSIVR